MVKILTMGGLGNQLFQYALYQHLTSQGKDVCLDLSIFVRYTKHYGFELTKVFNLNINICNEINKKLGFKQLLIKVIDRVNYEVFKRFDYQFKLSNITHYEYRLAKKNSKLFNLDNVRLVGYWQKEGYLIKNRSSIQSELKFKVSYDKVKYLDEIKKDETVLIHFRGGDFFSGGMTLDIDYYLEALKKFHHVLNPNYYVITDDIDYLNSMKLPIDYKVIDDYQGEDSHINMYLFSQAKNIILANSTFSWWGAYLNYDSKLVIIPRGSRIHPTEWVSI